VAGGQEWTTGGSLLGPPTSVGIVAVLLRCGFFVCESGFLLSKTRCSSMLRLVCNVPW
jgi:hypothetical protein